MNVGEQIKTMRKKKGLTLKDLSQRLGVSIAYLSNVERNATSPTVDVLEAISLILEVPISSFLSDSLSSQILIKKDERPCIYNVSGSAKWESLIAPEYSLTGICSTLYPHSAPLSNWGHDHDEVGVVISGYCTFQVADVTYELHEGDTIFVPKGNGHTAENTSDNPCILYWFYVR